MIYAADFETTTDPKDCRVWAWGMSNIGTPEDVEYGNTIDGYLSRIQKETAIIYFHNLKFDGAFILDKIFRLGYSHVVQEKDEHGKVKSLKPGEFTTLISDMGVWYSMSVCWMTGETTEFRDSAKLIPLPIEKIPSTFGLSDSKLELDYHESREYGHKLTQEEIAYLSEDVIIASKAVGIMINNGNTKLTLAANALKDYKYRIGKKEFQRYYPKLEPSVDADIRASYKGGWTYLNPIYADKTVSVGRVYDINSMYPWAMRNCMLPYGNPIGYKGKPSKKGGYPLYVVQFIATFKLKPKRYPSIQIKGSFTFANNEYIVEAGEPTLLTLTSVDFELFKYTYDYHILEYIGGYYFHGKVGLFTEYIDYWYDVKAESKRTGNKGMEFIAKARLNHLYGKFGTRVLAKSKIPYFSEDDDMVKYKYGEEEQRESVYIPTATFITSYCRDKIIRGADSVYDRFVYADTDSLHLLGDFEATNLEVDEFRLGAFKHESTFDRGRFVRQKTYIEVQAISRMDYDGYIYEEPLLDIKCAGMPRQMKKTVEEKDFYYGAVFQVGEGSKFAPKLAPRTVPGGVILREMGFKIK